MIWVIIDTYFFIDSYADGISETVNGNLPLLMSGFSLIILYFGFAMGRFNWVEQRVMIKWTNASDQLHYEMMK